MARLLGATGLEVLVRLSAFILMCIGIEIIWNGYSTLTGAALRGVHSALISRAARTPDCAAPSMKHTLAVCSPAKCTRFSGVATCGNMVCISRGA